MKNVTIFFSLLVCIFLSLIIEQFIPPLRVFGSARVDLVPIFFCYGALLLPFPFAILLAFLTGLFVDLSTLQFSGGHVEIALGWSIFFYVLFASLLQGFRPFFLRGRWEVHAFASGIYAVLFITAQFVMITFRRGGIEVSPLVISKILVPGSICFLLSPVVYFSAKMMGAMPVKRRVRQY
ncbi:MAG: hypothetical protein ABI443_12785 [Chthoniobacterales bacterium]